MRPRLPAAVGLALTGAVLLSACGQAGAALRRQEVVVVFDRSATQAQHVAARDACSGLPNVTPEPIGSSKALAGRLNNVRFRVDNADAAQVNRLYMCLQKQPGVVGVNVPDTSH